MPWETGPLILNPDNIKRRHILPYRVRKPIQRFKRLCYSAMLNRLLSHGSEAPLSFLKDAEVNRLDRLYPPGGSYSYDERAKRQRASKRKKQILDSVPTEDIRDLLELGGGDGHLSLQFQQNGAKAIIVDIEDWRDLEVKNAGVQFKQTVSGDSLPVAEESFDLAVSFNTMEHVPDPAETMSELIRAVRPGGWLFLNFGPLFNSPLGLHAYRTVGIPYVQFLVSNQTMQRFIETRGIYDLGNRRNEFQFVNGWSLNKWQQLLNEIAPQFESLRVRYSYLEEHVGLVLRNLPCFRGHGLTYEELTTSALTIVAKRLG